MAITSILKPENSLVAGIATMAIVVGIYNGGIGGVSNVHMTPANDHNVAAGLRKAGWTSLVAVSIVTLLARDANIAILGGATIIGEELSYRHAHMTSPETGQIEINPSDYQQAGSSYAAASQQTESY